MNDTHTSAIAIHHFGRPAGQLTPTEMADMSGAVFQIAERVPGAPEGEAFDWAAWYTSWKDRTTINTLPLPTHLKVEASDSFEAVIPWRQLEGAAVLFRSGGRPLAKSGPIRFYVPNGTSDCLNVKSVISIRLLHEPERGEDADYGFKNVFSPGELLKPKE